MDSNTQYWKNIWSIKDVFIISSIILISFSLLSLIVFLTKPAPWYSMLILDTGLFAIITITFLSYLKKKGLSWEEFGFNNFSFNFKWFVISILFIIFVTFIGASLSKIWSDLLRIGSENTSSLDMILSDKVWLNIFNLKIGVAILIPFAEELFFRGLIFRFLRQKRSFILSAIVSSLIFSLIHFDLASLPFTILLGLSTAFIFEKTKSIFFSFLVHMGVNNFAANMLLFSIL